MDAVFREAPNVWRVTVRPTAGGPATQHTFHHVAVCCGSNVLFNRTPYKGEDSFAGKVLHSSEYVRAADYAGKRVLVVGLGESGSDICLQIARVSALLYVCLRVYVHVCVFVSRMFVDCTDVCLLSVW